MGKNDVSSCKLIYGKLLFFALAETTPKLSIPLVGGDSQDISKDRSDRLSTSWVKDKAGEYDVCMVFPSEAGDFTATGKQYIRKIFLLGFETYIYR